MLTILSIILIVVVAFVLLGLLGMLRQVYMVYHRDWYYHRTYLRTDIKPCSEKTKTFSGEVF